MNGRTEEKIYLIIKTGWLDGSSLSDQHVTQFQGWFGQSLMRGDVGHLASRSWPGKTQGSGKAHNQGDAMLLFQMTHCVAESLRSAGWTRHAWFQVHFFLPGWP